MASLYIHIPFCVRKCGYCDFYSGAAGDADMERYLNALEREFDLRARHGLAPETIFIGGGTPTRLGAAQLRRLGAILGRHVDRSRCVEFTCEINPVTLTPEKADALAAMGVNRASFGVQSFDPRYLAGLDRAHEAGAAPRALAIARDAGIARLNVDLMFALPGQTLAEFESDLTQALALGTEHVSLYALTYEDDTPLSRRLKDGTVTPATPELEEAMFELAGRVTARAGLERYEVSNYARPGAECAHNLVYWTCGDWHGFGAGAHGMIGGVVQRNVADFAAYERDIGKGLPPCAIDNPMSPAERAETLLLMGLRLTRGVELARFRRFAGADFTTVCGGPAGRLVELGLLEFTPTHVRATPRGLIVLDSVILELAMALGYPA
ncbi:MAG: radical SAM family heme chaperone HemW [Planctomycetes bacterium]|jgi:oxygen-independent coproporphyrinogen-3 oxidase|nr:radical SAM family heme chaperone HemW [Planctomycetota bacterium]MCL4730726.1 radical SAM family heme chaperone HemW [Planctomycetota bacterium]